MAIAAVIPIGSELVMLYGGAIASGGIAGAALGHSIPHGFWSYVAIVVAGVVGNVVGAVAGWAIGDYGGHPLLERHGRWLHVTPQRIARAERGFGRFGELSSGIALATTVVRSFDAILVGMFELL